ncbi:hypothetical protein [Streptomyces mirabilis]
MSEQQAQALFGEGLDAELVKLERLDAGASAAGARRVTVQAAGLGLAAALALARQETWAAAHSQYAAQPAPDRPDGAGIATTVPYRWAVEQVRVLDLTP